MRTRPDDLPRRGGQHNARRHQAPPVGSERWRWASSGREQSEIGRGVGRDGHGDLVFKGPEPWEARQAEGAVGGADTAGDGGVRVGHEVGGGANGWT